MQVLCINFLIKNVLDKRFLLNHKKTNQIFFIIIINSWLGILFGINKNQTKKFKCNTEFWKK